MKKREFLSAVFLLSSIFGANRVDTLLQEATLLEQELQHCARADFSSPQAKSSCNNYLLAFDLLYWHPKTDLTELGGTRLRSGTNQENGSHTPAIDFDWTFGFKTGIGCHSTDRQWDLFAEYTRVQFTTSVSFRAGALRSIEPNMGDHDDSTIIDFMKGSHRIDYQTATLELRKAFCLGEFIDFKPAFGAKATWINQAPHMEIHITNSTPVLSQTVTLSEKTTGLGPLAMIYTKWYLCNGYSIYADSGMALLFTRYRGHMSVKKAFDTPLYGASNKEDKHYVTPNAILALGLSYERGFEDGDQHLIVALGYESQYYINQSYLMQNHETGAGEDEVEWGAFHARNLAVYGLTLSASLAF